jgi:hypothetical protein
MRNIRRDERHNNEASQKSGSYLGRSSRCVTVGGLFVVQQGQQHRYDRGRLDRDDRARGDVPAFGR